MKEIGQKEFKNLLLDAMVHFDRYCKENNLQYFLFYGSLIGAVRHHGFIPWDDDIDVTMPRKDYERLVREYKNDGRYKLVSIHNNKEYNLPLAKLIDSDTLLLQSYNRIEPVELGIYIDIFILDGVPFDKNARNSFMKKAIHYVKSWGIASLKFHKAGEPFIKSVARRIMYLPAYLMGESYFLKKADIYARTYDYENSDFVGNVSYMLDDKNWYYKEDFEPMLMEFEGNEFIIPKGYDRILMRYYGDWKTLPPEHERKSTHQYEVFWRE